MEDDDTDSIIALKHADLDAIEPLVRRYQVQAVRTAYVILHDRASAEDVVQSAFIRLPGRIKRFTLGRPFGPWFLRIVANDAIDVARRNRRLMPIEAADLAPHDPLAAISLTPETLVERAQTSDELWSLLGQLPPEDRAVVILRYYAGLKNVEIARELSIPTGTVGWRLHHALRALRHSLQSLTKVRHRKPNQPNPQETPQ